MKNPFKWNDRGDPEDMSAEIKVQSREATLAGDRQSKRADGAKGTKRAQV